MTAIPATVTTANNQLIIILVLGVHPLPLELFLSKHQYLRGRFGRVGHEFLDMLVVVAF